MKRTFLSRGTKQLARSGFKRKTYEEVKRTRVSLKKSTTGKLGAKKKVLRTKLPTVKSMRNKCDGLLTPIIKKLHPYCLLRGAENCAGVTQVAHHHVHKANSSRLRYEIDNLIPLCTACHCMLHCNESYWASKVVEKRGLAWFHRIDVIRNEYVKTDVHFYIENYKRLQNILEGK